MTRAFVFSKVICFCDTEKEANDQFKEVNGRKPMVGEVKPPFKTMLPTRFDNKYYFEVCGQ